MNAKIILNYLTPLIAVLTTWAANKWGVDPNTLQKDAVEWTSATITLILLLVGHVIHKTPATGSPGGQGFMGGARVWLYAILLTLFLPLVVSRCQAQTNTVPSFFTSAEQYLTSFNTNYTFEGVSFEMATGYKQVTGVGAASVVDAQYDIGKFHIPTAFQFSGVGSAINAAEIGVGYDLIEYYDTVLEGNLFGGYDWNLRTGEVETKVDIKKKMTPNTYTELGISLPVYFRQKFNNTPSFYIEAGFTF